MVLFEAKKYILNRLRNELPAYLSYHGYHHTLDVYEMAVEIAHEEGITNEEELILLKTAALYHDCGFLETYKGHEEVGCKIAEKNLPLFGYNEEQIKRICGMIMATKIPQTPTNHLEEIIADADLDYLGRHDFNPIAFTLFQELQSINAIHTEKEWNELQVKFISQHEYFTKTCKTRRKNEKEKRLSELKKLV